VRPLRAESLSACVGNIVDRGGGPAIGNGMMSRAGSTSERVVSSGQAIEGHRVAARNGTTRIEI